MKSALIVFVKNPVMGRVKTRLAKSIGDEAALKVYQHLLGYTRSMISELDRDIFVFHSEAVPDTNPWNSFHNEVQTQGDLGSKMVAAFTTVFNKGYDKVVLIGSDCIDIQSNHIKDAFEALDKNQVVIGPALDGGYYLIGMTKNNPSLFEEIKWSTATVFENTVHQLKIENLSFETIEPLSDVDEVADLEGKIDWKKL